jgi:hypothetical protein
MSTSLDSEGSWSVLEDKGDFSSPSEDNGKGKGEHTYPVDTAMRCRPTHNV